MKQLGLLYTVTILLVMTTISTNYIAEALGTQEEDIQIELAEKHKQVGREFEQNAYEFVKDDKLEQAIIEFENAAEQYTESAEYYIKLRDFLKAAESNALASVAYEKAAAIHYELEHFEKSIISKLLSGKYNSYSLQNKGITKFGDEYLLPPKHQMFLVSTPEEIKCSGNLELVFKIDDSPACVKSSSISKLKERGWLK